MEGGGSSSSTDGDNELEVPPEQGQEDEQFLFTPSPQSSPSRGSSEESAPLDLKHFIPGCVLLTFTFMSASMPAAYLPLVLRDEEDIPESISAIVISSATLSYVVSCFASPKLDELFDPHLILVVCYFFFIMASILFSYILYFPGWLIVPIAIVSRTLGGFCAGVFENIFSTIMIRKHDDKIGLLSGATEMAINAGYLAGPLFGGAVYQWTKSYALTQIIPLGPTALFYVMYCYIDSRDYPSTKTRDSAVSTTTSSTGSDNPKHAGFFDLFKRWQMVLIFFCPFFFSTACSAPTSITAPFVNDILHGTSATTGLLFFVMSLGYMPGSVLAGVLTDKPRYRCLTLWCFCLSPFLFGIGWLIAAPAPFLFFKPSVWTTGAGFFVGTVAFGFGSGPMLRILICVWRGLNPTSDLDYTAYITSMFLVTFSLGEGIGNALGGIMYEFIGYDQTIMIFGVLLLVHGCVNLTFTIICGKKNYMMEVTSECRLSEHTALLSERTALLSENTPLLDNLSQCSDSIIIPQYCTT